MTIVALLFLSVAISSGPAAATVYPRILWLSDKITSTLKISDKSSGSARLSNFQGFSQACRGTFFTSSSIGAEGQVNFEKLRTASTSHGSELGPVLDLCHDAGDGSQPTIIDQVALYPDMSLKPTLKLHVGVEVSHATLSGAVSDHLKVDDGISYYLGDPTEASTCESETSRKRQVCDEPEGKLCTGIPKALSGNYVLCTELRFSDKLQLRGPVTGSTGDVKVTMMQISYTPAALWKGKSGQVLNPWNLLLGLAACNAKDPPALHRDEKCTPSTRIVKLSCTTGVAIPVSELAAETQLHVCASPSVDWRSLSGSNPIVKVSVIPVLDESKFTITASPTPFVRGLFANIKLSGPVPSPAASWLAADADCSKPLIRTSVHNIGGVGTFGVDGARPVTPVTDADGLKLIGAAPAHVCLDLMGARGISPPSNSFATVRFSLAYEPLIENTEQILQLDSRTPKDTKITVRKNSCLGPEVKSKTVESGTTNITVTFSKADSLQSSFSDRLCVDQTGQQIDELKVYKQATITGGSPATSAVAQLQLANVFSGLPLKATPFDPCAGGTFASHISTGLTTEFSFHVLNSLSQFDVCGVYDGRSAGVVGYVPKLVQIGTVSKNPLTPTATLPVTHTLTFPPTRTEPITPTTTIWANVLSFVRKPTSAKACVPVDVQLQRDTANEKVTVWVSRATSCCAVPRTTADTVLVATAGDSTSFPLNHTYTFNISLSALEGKATVGMRLCALDDINEACIDAPINVTPGMECFGGAEGEPDQRNIFGATAQLGGGSKWQIGLAVGIFILLLLLCALFAVLVYCCLVRDNEDPAKLADEKMIREEEHLAERCRQNFDMRLDAADPYGIAALLEDEDTQRAEIIQSQFLARQNIWVRRGDDADAIAQRLNCTDDGLAGSTRDAEPRCSSHADPNATGMLVPSLLAAANRGRRPSGDRETLFDECPARDDAAGPADDELHDPFDEMPARRPVDGLVDGEPAAAFANDSSAFDRPLIASHSRQRSPSATTGPPAIADRRATALALYGVAKASGTPSRGTTPMRRGASLDRRAATPQQDAFIPMSPPTLPRP